LNHRPLGYEPNELPDCSTPQFHHNNVVGVGQTSFLSGTFSFGTQLIAARSRMSLRTLNDIFFALVERRRPKVMLWRRESVWEPLSSEEFASGVTGAARALHEWKIGRGDRVAILSENRPEWMIADFASLLLGAVTVPIYATLTAEQTAYILRDSGARAIFVSSEAQLLKVLSIREQTALERIVVFDPLRADSVETAGVDHMQGLWSEGQSKIDPQLEADARAVTADELATIIYTSGTTGMPKGVMLTHGNMASNLSCSLTEFPVREHDVSISFLPLSHVTARHVDFALLSRGVTLAYVPLMDQVPQALQEVRPTFFVAVPRVYEKIHFQTEQRAGAFPNSAFYRWALSEGRDHRSEILAGRTPTTHAWKLADRLVYSKVRAGLGGRISIFISGGAPLGRELAEWYADIGIRIHEGYGLTETSPVIAVNTPRDHKIGTVGKPLPNVEVRIADDGEVLVRGPSVFKQYWNKPKETQEAFVDGWFKTGDIGNLDGDGFLSITDRKKDLIKTSGGKFIAPQPIENSLKHTGLIAEAVVLGEKRKFPSVLIAPNFPALEDWARSHEMAFSSRAELVASPEVHTLYEGIVEELNLSLARFERLKRVLLVADEFSAENGTLTASMKLRRKVVAERYQRQIEEMYAQAETAGPVATSE
jgi:long-chain acyl-CoA synthetase